MSSFGTLLGSITEETPATLAAAGGNPADPAAGYVSG